MSDAADQQAREAAEKTLFDLGMKQRRTVLGDKYVDNQLAARKSEFSRPAQEYITRSAWEGLWSRPGLELKYRSLVVITILAIGGHKAELAAHTRGALRNGLTEDNIREAMLHVTGYGGFPKGLEAFRVCEEAIEAYRAEVAAEKGEGSSTA
ncbi:hypothetical protein CspHIS471_0202830 [Cutaneotrichosporon sp. HIS471]|nr:hypothetical protein CspHIS471_0202830 [Cutaneotrichosporon sp. HIS471]